MQFRGLSVDLTYVQNVLTPGICILSSSNILKFRGLDLRGFACVHRHLTTRDLSTCALAGSVRPA